MADRTIYVGNSSNVAVEPTKIYIGDSNDTAQEVSKIYVGNVSNKAVQVWPRYKWSDTYQRCEYLYNTNYTEYINTGIYPDSNTRVIIDAKKNNSTASTTDRYLFKTNFGEVYFGLYWDQNASNLGYLYFNFGAVDVVGFRTSDWWNDRHVYDYNRSGGEFYIDATKIGQSTNTFSTMSYPVIIWDYATVGSHKNDSYIARWNVYSFKIYQNGILVRDMWPCYRKSDYKPGMYDFANDVFYTNAGSGEFYKGPDVN